MERAPKADAFFDAFVGVFPENANLAYIEANYKEAFQPTALAHSVETFLTLMQEHHYTPQWFTREGLEEDFSGHSEFKFFILDPADAQDLIDLWNLRQFERNVIPIHIDWFDRCAPMMCDLITRNFRPLPGNPHGVMIRSTIEFARSIANEHAQRLVEAHIRNVPRDSWGFQLWYEPIWESRDDRMVFRPQRVRLSAANSDIHESISDEDLHVTFRTPSPQFLDDRRWYGRANWVNVIQPSRAFYGDELARVYPCNILNPSFPRLRLSEWSAISREGWALPQRHEGMSEHLQLQLGRDAFTTWFEQQGIKAVPSDAGRVAEQVIRMGSLHSCAMFAEENIVNY